MMSSSENERKNDIDSNQSILDDQQTQSNTNDSKSTTTTTVIQQSSDNDPIDEKLNQQEQSNDLIHETGSKQTANEIDSDNALITTTSPSIVNTDEIQQQHEIKESITTNHEDENHSKKYSNSKVKYSSMSYHQPPYYVHDPLYGTMSYYYPHPHHHHLTADKPTPLMFASPKSSSSVSSRDNQTGNSTSVSPQNLPPRLRQASTTENDSNSQLPATTSSSSSTAPTTTATTTTTNGGGGSVRRHQRSIVTRGANTYFGPHPPPLMATPPGVLFTYPPAVHQPGQIAYNIRPPDEFELLTLQQHMMNLPGTPILWSPQHAHPFFPPYPMDELPPAYLYDNSGVPPSASSFLNPEAAEWVPSPHEDQLSSLSEISIDDEISFPPLTSSKPSTQTVTNTKDSTEEPSEHIEKSSETTTTANNSNDHPTISPDTSNVASEHTITTESATVSSSSQDDTNESSINKPPPMTYSTIISQTSQNNQSNKANTSSNRPPSQQQQQSTNQVHTQQPPRDRTNKQRNTPVAPSSNFNSRRRQPLNDTPRNNTRNLLVSENNSNAKPQLSSEVVDDWIEVKSKKTKKFDRVINDHSSEKSIPDEPIPKSLSPPLSLTSTGDNTTTTTFTSEDDFDEKDNGELVILMNNETANDYNQTILNDTHKRLKNKERLLILMRGCPGSGKSTLAKLINNGFNGVILSTDDYFTDNQTNSYAFDANQLDEAHRFNRRRASEALKKNITPIIIDNTNTQVWEMKPYVAMGKEAGYEILLVEPQTPWRYKARELSKRNLHNLPLKRIREMVNRFEHNVTVQSILNQLPLTNKPNPVISSEEQNRPKVEEIPDSIPPSKKCYDLVDNSLILEDVRLCIDDMLLFLTSNFFQTTRPSQSSTPLSVSFHDLSLISPTNTSSLPSTPSTPHSRFHRPLARFPSSTSQDHSFHTEHILRLPTSVFPRCIEPNSLTPPLSASLNISGKKRRKNKNKQQANEILLNVNNNNNNNSIGEKQETLFLPTYQVFLPEDCSNFLVIDEDNSADWTEIINGIETSSTRDHSSAIPHQPKQFTKVDTFELINIIQSELTKPSNHSSVSTKEVIIQCSSEEFNTPLDQSASVLIGRLSSSLPMDSVPLSIRTGYKECGIQVDFCEYQLDLLMKIYSDRLSAETIEYFYEICHSDFQWTCAQIDEYLQNPPPREIPIEISNTSSVKQEILAEIPHQISMSSSTVCSLEEIYGQLPDKSSLTSTTNEILLPFDEDLSRSIHQAIERYLIRSNQTTKPVNKKQTNTRWKSTIDNPDVQTNQVPSLREIINEEQRAAQSQKTKQKSQLDYATEHKFKELEHHFPSFDRDLLYDIFHENEYDYDLTFLCLSTMFDENAVATPIRRIVPSESSVPCVKDTVEPVVDSYEDLRHNALRHAQQRKEFYVKAHQANGHGMTGVAAFYIHRASEETRRMEDANRMACERLSQWKLKEFQRTGQLDLHGLHSDEALNLFKQIERELNQGNQRTTPKSIQIITDYGKTSLYGGGHGQIRSIILTYLHQRNYQYSEPNKGVILLQLPNTRN